MINNTRHRKCTDKLDDVQYSQQQRILKKSIKKNRSREVNGIREKKNISIVTNLTYLNVGTIYRQVFQILDVTNY